MQVTIAVIGRDRSGPVRDLFQDYCRRCAWPVRLVALAPRTAPVKGRRLADEGARLLGAVPEGALVIALDERGAELDSQGLARRIGTWRDEGRSDLAFLIGGPDGLAPAVLERAGLILAFGRMTWPHRLVRVMLAEQLYRASTILSGHPYHRA
ncbi:MAG: 23S rRNA (pseudouridine(1915)-N(3))-methyltransferase RlmH [Geminicoccaceae bacterium]